MGYSLSGDCGFSLEHEHIIRLLHHDQGPPWSTKPERHACGAVPWGRGESAGLGLADAAAPAAPGEAEGDKSRDDVFFRRGAARGEDPLVFFLLTASLSFKPVCF